MNVDQGKGRRGTVGQVTYFQADARPPAPLPAAGHNARQQKPLWGKGPVRLFTGRLRFGAALAAAPVRMPLRPRRGTAGAAGAVGRMIFTGATFGTAAVALAIEGMAIPPPVPVSSGMRTYFHVDSLP